MVFLSGYLGLAAGFFPFVVPYAMTFRQAANADNALGLVLVMAGVAAMTIPGGQITRWLRRVRSG